MTRDAPKGDTPAPDAPNDKSRRSTMDSTTSTVVDVEHAAVEDDPRLWSPFRKNSCLFLISAASMVAGLAGNIQTPAIQDMEADLSATSQQFSLTLSIFIFLQGVAPLAWCAISEVKGRKLVYLMSLALFTLASIAVAMSTNIGLVIAFRTIQAIGSSSVIAIGAATLADIFDPAERGTKMGIYYMAPLLGPAIGPIIGGALTNALGWRSIFWFLCIVSGMSWLSFLLFFRDTFRKERSLTYQTVLKQHLKERQKTDAGIISSNMTAPPSTVDLHHTDPEKIGEGTPAAAKASQPEIQLSLKDVNPFKPIWSVSRRGNNLVILIASGIMFALTYMISYTSARTLSTFYHYDALMIGVVTISYGLGCVGGSLLGGRWSDYKLAKLKEANGGKSYPEMRLKSTTLGIWLLPPCIIGFGWVCDRHVHIAALCVLLFMAGFFTIWIYASTLSYLVDANVGRSGTIVAVNSAFRGLFAFFSIEVAVPMQDALGDGWLYTVWGVAMVLTGALLLLASWKGEEWRKRAEERDARSADESTSPDVTQQ